MRRFWCCERSPETVTESPPGTQVARTAEFVRLTCWPPGPEARQASKRTSSGRRRISAGSGVVEVKGNAGDALDLRAELRAAALKNPEGIVTVNYDLKSGVVAEVSAAQ